MPRFRVRAVETVQRNVTVQLDADNEREAYTKVAAGEFGHARYPDNDEKIVKVDKIKWVKQV